MSQYLGVLILSGVVPLAVSFWPPLGFYRNFGALCRSIALIVLVFGAWDVFAVWRGHWWFNPEGVYAARIINLPLEEVLFFVVIPFCCIFTWEALVFIGRKMAR